jgi:succinate dehydrogenase / fumarate reductase cytochrome b subunit
VSTPQPPPAPAAESFLVRHDFLLRRLHSLSGLIPIGAYLVVHLLTNASVLESPARFQENVYTIHSLGKLLPVVEWVFIFIPILFHAIFGFVIIGSGKSNTSHYPRGSNVRYTLQRVTGMIAFAFIAWHVFQMRGWIHNSWWMTHVTEPLGGAQFKPYNAASTAGRAMQGPLVNAFYLIGITASVFHLANGIWSMGITWGVWTTPAAQKRALRVCAVFGVLLLAVGLAAQYGMWSVGREPNVKQAEIVEDKIHKSLLDAGRIEETPEKRSKPQQTGTASAQPGAKASGGE